MGRLYEHLAWDITPEALKYLGLGLDLYLKQFGNIKSEVLVELQNFRNEITNREQRLPKAPTPIIDNSDLI